MAEGYIISFDAYKAYPRRDTCRSGGIGRRTGLKIRRSDRIVPVRPRSPVPEIYNGKRVIAKHSTYDLCLVFRRVAVRVARFVHAPCDMVVVEHCLNDLLRMIHSLFSIIVQRRVAQLKMIDCRDKVFFYPVNSLRIDPAPAYMSQAP